MASGASSSGTRNGKKEGCISGMEALERVQKPIQIRRLTPATSIVDGEYLHRLSVFRADRFSTAEYPGASMRILIMGAEGEDPNAIQNAIRMGQVEIVASRSAPLSDREDAPVYAFAGWVLNPVTRDLLDPSRRRIDLTSSEFDLLMAFIRRPGEPLPRADLMKSLKGRAWSYFDRSLDTLVARLRKKIDSDANLRLIRSVRGVGYVFCAGVSRMSLGAADA